MQGFAIGSSVHDPAIHLDDEHEQPILRIDGVEGTSLRATLGGLLVCTCRPAVPTSAYGHRRWRYNQVDNLRVDAYGPIGVIRATVRGTSTDLPLLLLEPDQITAARRALEVVWNLMGNLSELERAS